MGVFEIGGGVTVEEVGLGAEDAETQIRSLSTESSESAHNYLKSHLSEN